MQIADAEQVFLSHICDVGGGQKQTSNFLLQWERKNLQDQVPVFATWDLPRGILCDAAQDFTLHGEYFLQEDDKRHRWQEKGIVKS